MSDRTNIRRKKVDATITNPSLVSSSTPTLANSNHSLALQSNTTLPEISVQALSNQQGTQFNNEQLVEGEAFKQEPLGHDISRISLRPQSKLSTGQSSDPFDPEANWVADRIMRMPEPGNFADQMPETRFRGHDFSQMSILSNDRLEPFTEISPSIQRKCDACEEQEELPIQQKEAAIVQQHSSPVALAEIQRIPDLQRDPNGMPPKKGTTTINKQNTTITASGKTLTEAIVNLTSQGKGEAGSVTCKPEKDVKTYQADDKSDPIVYEADVVVTETKAMPVWKELAQQCEPVKKEWNRFYQALDTHENGHISIDERAFTNLHKKLLGKSESSAETIFNNTFQKANTDNDKYDSDTQHGLTQGTSVNQVQCGVEKLSESETSPLENGDRTSDIPNTDSTTLMAKRTSQPSSVSQSQGHDLRKISMLPVRAKLTVSQSGDPYEQEADRVANEVMRMQIPESNEAVAMRSLRDTIHRKCAVCEGEELLQLTSTIQRSGDDNLPAEGDIESRLNSSKSGGSPLSDDVRAFMEPRFGTDFSDVKVHTNSSAIQMNKDLNAQAFVHETDVYFGAGKSPGNNELTAHELTHVVQQTGKVQSKRPQNFQEMDLKGEPSRAIQFKAVSRTDVIGQPGEADTMFAQVGAMPRTMASDLTPKTLSTSDLPPLSRKQNVLNPPLIRQQPEGSEATTTPKNVESIQQQSHGNSNAEPMIQRSLSLDDLSLDKLTNFGEATGWAIVGHLAPELEPILRKGPGGIFEWMKNLIGSSLEGVFNGLMAPVRSIAGIDERLTAHFGPLLASLQTAATQIANNDCTPISEAAAKIEKVAEDLITPIVQKLQPIVATIKDFLNGIWDKIGAPIWGWIKDYAAEQWASIQQLGEMLSKVASWIWKTTGGDKMWTWLKNKLGIGDGVEGQNGLLQWVQRKVEEAWKAIEAKLEPFKKELTEIGLAVGAVALAVSPAGPVIAVGAAIAGAVQGIRWIAANWGKGNIIVQSREYLEKSLIPALQGAANRLGATFKQMAGALSSALGNLAAGMTRAVGAISGSLLKVATSAIQWIADRVKALADWAQQQLNDLTHWLEEVLIKLQTFLQKMLDLFMEVGKVVLDIWLLPAFLGKQVWTAIPECIRDPIIDFIGPIILRQIEIFQALARDNDAWQKTKKDVLQIVHLVFTDHDLMGAIKATFNLILRVFNIPPDLLSTVIAKAENAWDVVSKEPLEFIKNIVRSIGKGFGLLWENIGEHLKFGLVGWLTGGLAENNITLPNDWSEPKEVFGFVLDVMGLTVDHMWRLLEEHFEDENKVRKLRNRIGQVSSVIEWIGKAIDPKKSPAENTAGILEQTKGFGMSILTGIAEWIAAQVATELETLAAAAAASGGLSEVLDLVRRIYKAILTAVRWARQILDMVNETLDDDITSIAGGNIATAGAKLEQIMHKEMAVVIGFLADQVGLDGIGSAIKDIVTPLRAEVDKAINWVIEKLKAGIETVIGAVKEGVDALVEWWKAKKEFKTKDNEIHTLFFEGESENATLMVASQKKTFTEFIDDIDDVDANSSPSIQKAKADALLIAKHIDEICNKRKGKGKGVQTQKGIDIQKELIGELNKLAVPTSLLAGQSQENPPSVIEYGSLTSDGGATFMNAKILSTNNSEGSEPEDKPLIWTQATRRPNVYVRGHLLNDNIGGPGKSYNLAPITDFTNKQHLNFIEKYVKKAVTVEKKVVRYRVEIIYSEHPNRSSQTGIQNRLNNKTSLDKEKDKRKLEIMKYEQENLPRAFSNEWAILKYEGGKWIDDKVQQSFSVVNNLPDTEPEII